MSACLIISVHCDDFSWPICLALFKTCGVKYIITHLKFGLYPKTDSSNIRLGMIENIDAVVAGGKDTTGVVAWIQ